MTSVISSELNSQNGSFRFSAPIVAALLPKTRPYFVLHVKKHDAEIVAGLRYRVEDRGRGGGLADPGNARDRDVPGEQMIGVHIYRDRGILRDTVDADRVPTAGTEYKAELLGADRGISPHPTPEPEALRATLDLFHEFDPGQSC